MREWILSSSVLIVMVIAIRCFFRYKLSMRMRYALWLAVALRLLIPVSLWESSFSILNLLGAEGTAADQDVIIKQPDARGNQDGVAATDAQPTVPDTFTYTGDDIGGKTADGQESGDDQEASSGQESSDGLRALNGRESSDGLGALNGRESSDGLGALNGRGYGDESDASSGRESGGNQEGSSDGRESGGSQGGSSQAGDDRLGVSKDQEDLDNQEAFTLLFRIWLFGMIFCMGITLMMNISYSNRIYRSRKRYTDTAESKLPVYISSVINTPCMFGLLHPAVYLTPMATEEEKPLKYILCHENTHYRHKDNLWALVRVVSTCIHWYNPLVWLAAYLSRQDCELACDEETLEILGEKERINYGRALLDFSVQNSMLVGDFRLSTTISGGKKQLKERLLVIAERPEKYVSAMATVIILESLVLLTTFTGRKGQGLEEDGFINGGNSMAVGIIGLESDFSVSDGFGGLAGDSYGRGQDNPGSGGIRDGMDNSGGNTTGDDTGNWDGGNAGDVLNGLGSDSPEENQPETEYYTERVSVNLNDGEEYILRVGGETVTGSGEYQINLLELCQTHGNGEEVLQSIDMEELKVLYTRPWTDSGPYSDSISSMWLFSTDEEPLYAKPLCTSADLPVRAVGQFVEDGSRLVVSQARDGGIVMADLNFDGYEDLCLTSGSGSANVPYYCFLWNSEEKQFEYSYMIPNARADEGTRLIESTTVDGDGIYSVKYYSFDEENTLHLVRYVEENQSEDAVFPVLDLTYCETSYALPAVDEWDYGTEYGGALAERMVYWAKQALTELYEWSGTKVDTACFSVDQYGNFWFGNSPGDLQAGRIFYDRCYGTEAGFGKCITCMYLVTERTAWFSPVTWRNIPGNLENRTDLQVAEWFFACCPLAEDEVLDTIEEYEDGYVIRTKSGNYYELFLDKTVREVTSIYGPYGSYPVH